MVTKLRLMLDYHCYPVWQYNEKDHVVDTLLPEELHSDTELDGMFDSIQARYDALFIDTEKEFSLLRTKSFSRLSFGKVIREHCQMESQLA